jgi:alpha-L-fucosidase
VLGWPEQEVVLSSLGAGAAQHPGKVAHVERLGSLERIHFKQTEKGLQINPPLQKPWSDSSAVFKLSLG